MAKGDYVCDNCGFTWNPKKRKPGSCPNCDTKNIKPEENLFKDSGIDAL